MTASVAVSPTVQAVQDVATAAMTGPLADVAVLGAADLTQIYDTRSLTIGGVWDAETGEVSATDTIAVETSEVGLGRLTVETTRVSCIAYASSGDLDLATHRATANDILSAFRDGLRAMTDLGGTSAANAQIDSQQWAQIIDTQGSGVVVTFDVIVMVLP